MMSSDDSEIDSDGIVSDYGQVESDKNEEVEAPNAKKLRLAEEYLAKLRNEKQTDEDSDTHSTSSETSDDDVNRKLLKLSNDRKGNVSLFLMDSFKKRKTLHRNKFFVSNKAITDLCIHNDKVFLSSKNRSIYYAALTFSPENKMDFSLRFQSKGLPLSRKFQNVKHFPGHRFPVVNLAISPDGKILASCGSKEKFIWLWIVKEKQLVPVQKLFGHRGYLTSLCFDPSRNTNFHIRKDDENNLRLFSGAKDRTIRVWHVNPDIYQDRDEEEEFSPVKIGHFVEELFGHKAGITNLSVTLHSNGRTCRLLSASEDNSVIFSKIEEENHLVFQEYHSSSVDACGFLDSLNFLSGSCDRNKPLAAWHTSKRKPVVKIEQLEVSSALESSETWISSIAVCQGTDLFAVGGLGWIKIYGYDIREKEKGFEQLEELKVKGWVNSLKWEKVEENDVVETLRLFVALGGEHRLGRWNVKNKVPGSFELISFSLK
eukprot:snap_masked-scaffold_1-processed-gene-26.22-mRNA-1 protein AED:1.00 eAED:1.00 QI:0/-1/0/0/-1/1/1/0/485